MTDLVYYRFHSSPGAYTVETRPMPEGCHDVQDALAAWGATNRGQVTSGGATAWMSSYALRHAAVDDFGGAALLHWPDDRGETLILTIDDADLSRLQTQFTLLLSAATPILPTLDSRGRPADTPSPVATPAPLEPAPAAAPAPTEPTVEPPSGGAQPPATGRVTTTRTPRK